MKTPLLTQDGIAAIGVPRGNCAAWKGQDCCSRPAPYAVYFFACPPCLVGRGLTTCIGHGTCDEHAIDARNGNRRSYLDGTRLRVERIKSWGEPA